jgi:serine protease Do
MKHRLWIMLGCIALVAVGLAFAHSGPAVAATPAQATSSAQALGQAFSQVARTASPAVVYIEVEKHPVSPTTNGVPFQRLDPQFFQKFFPNDMLKQLPPTHVPVAGQGSGFLISPDGYIMTNGHVVQGAERIEVTLNDGRSFRGHLVGADSHSDVALVKIPGKGFPYLHFGNSDALQVGQWVVAIGSPYGLQSTVTAGIVSAKGRTRVGITDYEDFIQTDAAINPGNSGGPLLNLQGQVVGINSAIYSRNGGSVGLGFAIPARLARGVEQQLRTTGTVRRGFLGVMIQGVTPALAQRFGAKTNRGVLIAEVSPGSPAAKAGLEVGDLVVKLDGKQVHDAGSFRNRIAQRMPGSKVDLGLLRDGKPTDAEVQLGRLTDGAQAGAQPASNESTKMERMGLEVTPLTPDLAREKGIDAKAGLLVLRVDPGSPAARAGLEQGNVIVGIDRKPVTSSDALQAALSGDHHDVLLRVLADGHKHFALLSLD